jgi:hypothetical protein
MRRQEEHNAIREKIAALRAEPHALYIKAKAQGNYHKPRNQKRVGDIGKEIHELQGGGK